MPRPDRRIAFAVVAATGATALSLALAEAALRQAGWRVPGLFRDDGRGPLGYAVPGPEGGAWRDHSGPGRLRYYDYDVPVRINVHGFREDEPRPKRHGEWRVGLLGDSFAAGNGVRREERFGELWWSGLRHGRRDRASLWNLATPWCGTAHSADILGGVGREYELDEIVLAFFGGNDLQDNAEWLGQQADRRAGRAPTRALAAPAWRTWLRENSRLATFVVVRSRRLLGRDRRRVLSSAEVDELWPSTEAALGRLLRAAGGRPLTVWYLPDAAEWDDGVWARHGATRGLRTTERHAVRDRMRDWSTRHAVPFVDATPWLAGHRVAELVFPYDPHWNAAGHRVVATGLGAQAEACALVRRPG